MFCASYFCFYINYVENKNISFECIGLILSLAYSQIKPFDKNLTLCDCNWTRTQNHLVRKRTLNHLGSLAKWLSARL